MRTRARASPSTPAGHLERGVGQVGIVPAQVEVDPAGPRDRAGCPEALGLPRAEDPDTCVGGVEQGCQVGAVERGEGPAGPEGGPRVGCAGHAGHPLVGHISSDPADLAEHRVHAMAGRRLDQVQDLLAPPPRASAPGVGQHPRQWGEEGEVVGDARQLAQQDPQVLGALGWRQAQCTFHAHDHTDLRAERRQPVVAVHEHEDLAVVTGLEQLLSAAVDGPGDPFGRRHDTVGDLQRDRGQPVEGRVVRAEGDVTSQARGIDHPMGRRPLRSVHRPTLRRWPTLAA